MARIVGGSMIGELSGKMGGLVFSRNKSGQYIRKYAIPVNPNTGAQLTARASFAGAVGSFHSLDPNEKTLWQNFAQTAFNPKGAINTGQFSGINAYTALNQMVIHGNKFLTSPTLAVNGSPVTPAPSYSSLTFSDTPPVFTVQPNLKDNVTGQAVTYGSIEGGVANDGSFEVKLNLNPTPTGPATLAGFEDAVGHPIAYAVYMSEAHVQGGLFYNNPFKYLLGIIPTNDAGPSDLSSVTDITFTASSVIDTANYQAFPTAGNFVRVSVYAVSSSDGSMQCIGTMDDGSGLQEMEVGNTPY
jgi:hypothetical protein